MSSTAIADPLVVRGAAYGLLARLIGPDGSAIADGSDLAALRDALSRLGDEGSSATSAALEPLDAMTLGADDVERRYDRLFEQNRVSPYALSYVSVGPGGHTARLADVSGFYRAFGFRVDGERADHIVAELEFASFLAFAEAQAHHDHNVEGAEVCADAARSFLRDHLGGWLDGLADRLAATDPDGPHHVVARAAARFVEGETTRLGIDPAASTVTASGWLPDDDEDAAPSCAGCPLPPEEPDLPVA